MIELLVVVAVIAVLAAILLPSLQTAKERTKRAACLQNMRQVAVALQMLASDNDGWINGINAPTDTNGTAVAVDWTISVAPYLGRDNTNIYGQYKLLSYTEAVTFCPSRLPSRPDPTSGSGYSEGWYPYGANTLLVGFGYYPMHRLSDVRHTSEVFLLADCYTAWPASWFYTYFNITCGGNWGSGVWVHSRHPARPGAGIDPFATDNGLNFVFVDGHGEFLKQTGDQYWQSQWALYRGHTPTEWPFTFGLTINGE